MQFAASPLRSGRERLLPNLLNARLPEGEVRFRHPGVAFELGVCVGR